MACAPLLRSLARSHRRQLSLMCAAALLMTTGVIGIARTANRYSHACARSNRAEFLDNVWRWTPARQSATKLSTLFNALCEVDLVASRCQIARRSMREVRRMKCARRNSNPQPSDP